MSDGERQPPDFLLGQAQRRPRLTFGFISALILLAMVAVVVAEIAEDEPGSVLPIEFRLVEPRLSNLPVRIDRIRSCSCWHGPRDQAQRKYKFRVVNNTDRIINVGGGSQSMIRLIVAYPNQREPRLTVPAPSDGMPLGNFESPPDIQIPVTRKIVRVRPSEIRGANEFFGVPDSYSVWALPAAPNKIAEEFDPPLGSYPTVVDKTYILPGEEYASDRLGHGTWTFYIPLPHRFAASLELGEDTEPILDREVYERYVIFVGIAALAPAASERGKLLGFAPAPSENALAFPSEL
ncbi:MAG TPA: hypothetical protein VN733_02505 [Solirubrobacterales bacterium]|nr:hypothetical protein [Solirubrobacterales bacterium]